MPKGAFHFACGTDDNNHLSVRIHQLPGDTRYMFSIDCRDLGKVEKKEDPRILTAPEQAPQPPQKIMLAEKYFLDFADAVEQAVQHFGLEADWMARKSRKQRD